MKPLNFISSQRHFITLLAEFKEIHFIKARRHRYSAHINDREYQKRDGYKHDRYSVRHVFEGADDTEQEKRQRVDDGHKHVGIALCVVAHSLFKEIT